MSVGIENAMSFMIIVLNNKLGSNVCKFRANIWMTDAHLMRKLFDNKVVSTLECK